MDLNADRKTQIGYDSNGVAYARLRARPVARFKLDEKVKNVGVLT